MTDNRFKDFPIDARFPSPGVDVRFPGGGVDARFLDGLDTRFEGGSFGGGSPIAVTFDEETGILTITINARAQVAPAGDNAEVTING